MTQPGCHRAALGALRASFWRGFAKLLRLARVSVFLEFSLQGPQADPEHLSRLRSVAARLLEHEIVPLFYDLNEDGVPHGWVKMMKESMKKAAPFFSTRRMLKEYAITLYQHALQKEGI